MRVFRKTFLCVGGGGGGGGGIGGLQLPELPLLPPPGSLGGGGGAGQVQFVLPDFSPCPQVRDHHHIYINTFVNPVG